MKRIEYLIPLSQEHHKALVLAKHCLSAVASGDQDEIQRLMVLAVTQFADMYEPHFNQEEATLFPAIRTFYPEQAALCDALIDEHQQMRILYQRLKQDDVTVLGEFSQCLKDHTRKEERELFGAVNTAEFSDYMDSLSLDGNVNRP